MFSSFALLWTIVWAQPGLIGWFESDCPDGWGPYDSVEGRSIVGAGSQFQVSQRGGTSTIVLSSTQIPKHDHSLFRGTEDDRVLGSSGTACVKKYDGYSYHISECSGEPNVGKSGYQYSGSQSSINIQDPYLALNACILLVDITNQTVGYHSSMISNLQSADISQTSRLQDLETQSNANGQLISENTDVISDHSVNLEQNDASLLLHTSRLETLESGYSDHSTNLEQNNELLESHSTSISSHSTSISSLQASDIRQNSGIEALESSVETNVDNIAALSSDLESLEASVNEDHTALTNLQKDVTDNSLSITGLETSVGVLNGQDFSSLSTSVAVLDVKVQSMESTLQQFSSALETVEEMQEVVATFQNDLTTLENSGVLINEQFEQLQSQHMSLDNSVNSLQSSNSALTTSMQGIETRVSQIEFTQSTDSSTISPLNAGSETENETTILTSMFNDIVTIISIPINVILGIILYIVRKDVDTMKQTFLRAGAYNGGGEQPHRKPGQRIEMGLYRDE